MRTKDGLELIVPMKARGTKSDEEILACHDGMWIAEHKLDGHYFTAYYNGGKIRFFSRSISAKTGIFTERTENLECLQIPIPDSVRSFIVCGEIVHPLGKDSVTSVIGGSKEHSEAKQKELGEPSFVLFDILEYNGKDLISEPYNLRRRLLNDFRYHMLAYPVRYGIQSLKSTDMLGLKGRWFRVMSSLDLQINASEMFEQAIRVGFEGCVYKHRNSVYEPGIDDKVRPYKWWVKHKKKKTYDVVIMSFTQGEGKYAGQIGAIKFGQYINGKLTEIGQCSGMDDSFRLQLTRTKDSQIGRVITVEAQERSRLGRLRHPQFKGYHPEKCAEDCVYSESEC